MAFLQAEAGFTTLAFVATTAKSAVGVKAPTNQAIKILEEKVSFDGSTSSNAPAVVDFCRCTFATNAPGTASTSLTPAKRDPGRAETVQSTAAFGWTTEPTVITVQTSIDIPQFNGVYHYIVPFAAPIIVAGGQGYVIRVTSPNNVNGSGGLLFEE